MNVTLALWRAVMAHLLVRFAGDIDLQDWLRGSSSWNAEAWNRLVSAPIQADLSPEGRNSATGVGIGLAITERPRESTFGGQLSVREFTAAVTVTVRSEYDVVTVWPAYEILLHIVHLAVTQLAAATGEIGGAQDPGPGGVGTPRVMDVMQIVDEGDVEQDVDDNGDYVAVRNFTITLA